MDQFSGSRTPSTVTGTATLNVNPSITVPADGGALVAHGRVSLRVDGTNNGDAQGKVTLEYNTGSGPTACRSVEQFWDAGGDSSSIPIAIDCVVANPIAGTTYTFTLKITEGPLGGVRFGDPSGTGTDDTISIDAFWYPGL